MSRSARGKLRKVLKSKEAVALALSHQKCYRSPSLFQLLCYQRLHLRRCSLHYTGGAIDSKMTHMRCASKLDPEEMGSSASAISLMRNAVTRLPGATRKQACRADR